MYILKTNLPENTNFIKGLTLIFGLNSSTALKIIKEFGITKTVKTNKLTIHLKNKIIKYIEKNFIFGDTLKQSQDEQLKMLKNLRCYPGLRALAKLPRRGQRTHTNAKTAKKI